MWFFMKVDIGENHFIVGIVNFNLLTIQSFWLLYLQFLGLAIHHLYQCSLSSVEHVDEDFRS